ncbi:MAG: sulfatase [Armatimonadota bacterium]
MNRPNVLYIHSHDTGRYIQPYGHAVPTPNFQRLAEEGVLFRQAFCAAPVCSASRAALLTGKNPHVNGMIGLAHNGFRLNDPGQHLAAYLQGLGYHTALCGVEHTESDPTRLGYKEILIKGRAIAENVVPSAVAFLKSRDVENDANAEPFFLSVGFFETHREFADPGPHEDPRYCQPPSVLPDTPETRADMAAFKASARLLDEGVGAVLQALEESGLAENTLVISTTDHGIAFPAMKCNLTDQGTGVMLILRGPGGQNGTGSRWTGGLVIDSMVSHLDLFPTICETLGSTPPPGLEGRSLLPLLDDNTLELHEELFSEVTYHAAYEPQRAVRTRRWKYIRRFDPRSGPVLSNCDDSPSKYVWIDNGWGDREPAEEQLYDLMFDPLERHNLAGQTAQDTVLNDMRERLRSWMEETQDPLLKGPVLLPPGTAVNWTPDDIYLSGERAER